MEHFDLCPVLTLDADRLDFVKRDGDLMFIYDQVRRFLAGDLTTKTYQPVLL